MRRELSAFTRATSLLLLVAVLLAALALWVMDPIALNTLRLAQFDQLQRWQPRQVTPGVMRVVDVDEASLAAHGQWPWPRIRLVELVQRLQEAGVAAIAFDVLLAEPDRTAPQAMSKLWQSPSASILLKTLPDPDEALAHALSEAGVVLGSSLSNNASVGVGSEEMGRQPALPFRVVSAGTLPAWGHEFHAAVWPLPSLAAQADGLGAMNFAADTDGVLRRVPLIFRLKGQWVPSLSAEALRVSQGARNYLVRSSEVGVQEVRIGAVAVPTTAQGEIWLDFGQQIPNLLVPAVQVLSGQLATGQLTGQIVVIGSTAAGLMDLRSSPLGSLMPGVQAHVMALSQMLSGQYLLRPSWARGAEGLALLLGGLITGLVALRAPVRWSASLAVVLVVTLLAGAWFAFLRERLLLDAVNPALAVLLIFGLASGVRHRMTERRQRWLRQAFSRYVSPNRVAHLMAHPEQLTLSGKRQQCSFVFTDLEGFTSMIEASDPGQIVGVINDYLDAMLAIIFKHEGTLDRFMGDALVVIFSAPVPQADYRQLALDCALEMHAFASHYARQQQAQGLAWGSTRIGVHSGEVIVGNFGGKNLFDYRALGDPINTAARLESVNKHLGTRGCVSQAILTGCSDATVRPVGRLLLKGKTEALQAFEPFATMNAPECASPADYGAAFEAMQQGPLGAALSQFEALSVRHPQDPLVALHLARLRQGELGDLTVLGEK
jgi:adenylate cyclase